MAMHTTARHRRRHRLAAAPPPRPPPPHAPRRLRQLVLQLVLPASGEHAANAAAAAAVAPPPPAPELELRLGRTGHIFDPTDAPPATVFSPAGHCDYYGSKGFLLADPGMRQKLLGVPSGPGDRLASASAPLACAWLL